MIAESHRSLVLLFLSVILALNRPVGAQIAQPQNGDVETKPVDVRSIPAPDMPSADKSGSQAELPLKTYFAKVALADGADMLVSPAVLQYSGSTCKVEVFRSGTVVLHVPFLPPNVANRPTAAFCPATFLMPGYRSAAGVYDGQTILLKRLGPSEGSTVSITVLSAPPRAKEAYSRGELALARGHWDKAISQFKTAVKIYPKYAVAWSELGRALESFGEIEEAEKAYRFSAVADPMYIKPYFQLASLAAQQMHWGDVFAATQPALKLNPIEFPGVYFYDALASMNLGNLPRAEQSARKSIEIDARGEFPRAYMVLGTILLQKNDRRGAVAAYRDFLRLAPAGSEANVVRGWIARLEDAQ